MVSTGIPTSELRGALVVFCAGAMMYVGKDGMNAACGKLDQALGGANYLGITFLSNFRNVKKKMVNCQKPVFK